MTPAARKKPPKPRLPARAKGEVKKGAENGSQKSSGRVTTAELAARLDRVTEVVESIESSLSPQERSLDVAAEEHALLNLVDSIVDKRTEGVLMPLAHLATILDRLIARPDADEQRHLIRESNTQLTAVLEALGLERILPNRGDESDPWLHEEVDINEESDLDEGLIDRIVRPGIKIRGGRTLLPALVAISGRRSEES